MSQKPTNPTRQELQAALAAWQVQVAQAQEQPWLAALLLRQGERLFRRFVYYYQQLRALPRKTRRAWQKKLATTLAGAALLLALAGPMAPPAYAANITVDGTTCTLADAITAANTDTATGGCAAGSGVDTITLQTDVTLTGALPNITTQMTIEGNGYTIDGNNGVYHVLYVANTGDLTLNSATITGGNANGGFPNNRGGGIFNLGTVTVSNSTISGNSANSWGGGIYGGTVTVNNSTISGNTADRGGGIFSWNTVTVTNSTISGNTASNGGGIHSSTVTVNNSTISGNTANSRGGGIYNYGALTLNRSLISGNAAAGGGNEIYNYFGPVNADNYNLFGHSGETNAQAFFNFTPGANDITATSDGTNPTALASILNTTLANNGTQPHPFTHALVAGSPAIDVIPTTDPNCNPGSSVDQRGGARANGANQGGSACDIGAFEFDSSQTPTAVSLQSLTASSSGGSGGLAAAFGAVSLALGGLWLRLRKS